MAEIIPFEPDPRRAAPRGGASKGSAKVLFFTGVRYERREEAVYVAADGPRTIKQRPSVSRKLARRDLIGDTGN